MAGYVTTADGFDVGVGDAVFLDGGEYAEVEEITEGVCLVEFAETGLREWVEAGDCWADPDNDPNSLVDVDDGEEGPW